MSQSKQQWNCALCTFTNTSDRKDCEMCGTAWNHSQTQQQTMNAKVFASEVTNTSVINHGLKGTIREIKLIDQFEDKQLKALIKQYDTCSAICGYLSCAIPHYLLSNHQFPFNKKYRKMTDDAKENDNILDIVINKLCDSEELSHYVSKSMEFIMNDRVHYIFDNTDKFKNNKEMKAYQKAWVANYEISRYIQTMDCEYKKYIIFLRCNQYREIEITNREERDLVIKEEKPFGKEIRFLLEFFEPNLLIKCDNNYNEFIKECKKRDIDDTQSLLWILDLHGHYNTAMSLNINNDKTVVIMDTYLANHCSNPAALQCFDLVFNANNDMNTNNPIDN